MPLIRKISPEPFITVHEHQNTQNLELNIEMCASYVSYLQDSIQPLKVLCLIMMNICKNMKHKQEKALGLHADVYSGVYISEVMAYQWFQSADVFQFVATHLTNLNEPTEGDSTIQLESLEIIDNSVSEDLPVILAGDLNADNYHLNLSQILNKYWVSLLFLSSMLLCRFDARRLVHQCNSLGVKQVVRSHPCHCPNTILALSWSDKTNPNHLS